MDNCSADVRFDDFLSFLPRCRKFFLPSLLFFAADSIRIQAAVNFERTKVGSVRTADPRAFYSEGPVWVGNARRVGRDCLAWSSDRPRKLRRSGRFRAAFDNRARSDAQGEANDRHPKGRSARPRAGMMERWRLAL